MTATPRMGNAMVRNGLVFGLFLGLLGLGNSLAQALTGVYHVVSHTAANGVTSWAITTSGPSVPLGCVLFLAMLALTFGAGLLAARGNGRVGSGALVGLLAGVVGALVGAWAMWWSWPCSSRPACKSLRTVH